MPPTVAALQVEPVRQDQLSEEKPPLKVKPSSPAPGFSVTMNPLDPVAPKFVVCVPLGVDSGINVVAIVLPMALTVLMTVPVVKAIDDPVPQLAAQSYPFPKLAFIPCTVKSWEPTREIVVCALFDSIFPSELVNVIVLVESEKAVKGRKIASVAIAR